MTTSEPPSPEPVQPPAAPALYPVSSSPYGLTPQHVKPRLSAWIWVLAGLSALLLLAAGSVGFLYFDSKSANDRSIADRAAQIEELKKNISNLERARDDLDREHDDVSGDLDDSEAQLDELSACPDALNAVLAMDVNNPAFRDATRAMLDACNVV